jgi:hypothetical protein
MADNEQDMRPGARISRTMRSVVPLIRSEAIHNKEGILLIIVAGGGCAELVEHHSCKLVS